MLRLHPSLFYKAINTRPFLQPADGVSPSFCLHEENVKAAPALGELLVFRLCHLKGLFHSLDWATLLAAEGPSGGFSHRDFPQPETYDLSFPKQGPEPRGLRGL